MLLMVWAAHIATLINLSVASGLCSAGSIKNIGCPGPRLEDDASSLLSVSSQLRQRKKSGKHTVAGIPVEELKKMLVSGPSVPAPASEKKAKDSGDSLSADDGSADDLESGSSKKESLSADDDDDDDDDDDGDGDGDDDDDEDNHDGTAAAGGGSDSKTSYESDSSIGHHHKRDDDQPDISQSSGGLVWPEQHHSLPEKGSTSTDDFESGGSTEQVVEDSTVSAEADSNIKSSRSHMQDVLHSMEAKTKDYSMTAATMTAHLGESAKQTAKKAKDHTSKVATKWKNDVLAASNNKNEMAKAYNMGIAWLKGAQDTYDAAHGDYLKSNQKMNANVKEAAASMNDAINFATNQLDNGDAGSSVAAAPVWNIQ